MKFSPYVISLVVGIMTCNLAPLFAKDAAISPEQLRSELETALQSKDTNRVLSLFNSEAETNECRESVSLREMMIRRQTTAMLQFSDVTVSLLPMPATFSIPRTNERDGILTKFNTPIVGIIEVKSHRGSVVQLPYGKNASGCYIAGISQHEIAGQLLYVRVLAGPNTDSLTYTGRWLYANGAHEISVEFSDRTNQFLFVRGDYIKTLEIRRTSTNEVAGFPNWFHFQISEGEKHVFESPELTNEDLFIYHR